MLPKLVTPKYDMIVPSTGESITYRPYVVKEEKILLIAFESQDETQIEKSVLKNEYWFGINVYWFVLKANALILHDLKNSDQLFLLC